MTRFGHKLNFVIKTFVKHTPVSSNYAGIVKDLSLMLVTPEGLLVYIKLSYCFSSLEPQNIDFHSYIYIRVILSIKYPFLFNTQLGWFSEYLELNRT